MHIEISHIHKRFGTFQALQDIHLHVPDGELVALLGPSGCGKTTLLRIVAGLEQADVGRIVLGGQDVTSRSVRDRQIGFVFQHDALFAHLTAFENIAFGLRIRPKAKRPNETQIKKRVMALLDLVQLDAVAHQYPWQLSGGQRQRIALAQALAIEPRVLLLDEPFGALDAQVRKALRQWLRRIHDELHMTSIFVTHDQEEAFDIADRIVMMNNGMIEQVGRPDDIYQQPATPFVHQFLGTVNTLYDPTQTDAPPRYIRPHELTMTTDLGAAGIIAQVDRVSSRGVVTRVTLSVRSPQPTTAAQSLEVELTNQDFQQHPVQVGQTVVVRPTPDIMKLPAKRIQIPQF